MLRLLVVFALIIALSSCVSHQPPLVPRAETPQADIPDTGAPYVRRDWPHWVDHNGDCRNTRADMLLATSSTAVVFRDARQCTVASGRWFDDYTGDSFTQAGQLDIDHLVPLAWANRRGGSTWSRVQKQHFANDPGNLRVVSSRANRAKGSRGPDNWLPPRQAYQCQYVRDFDALVSRYRLQYLPQEKRSIRQLLSDCVGARR